MAKRLCKCGCGESLDGLDKRRQFLNDTHRKRVGRGSKPSLPTVPVSTEIADRLRREFDLLTVLDTYEAQTALGIAVQLDSGGIVGAAFVSLSKELDRRVDALRLKVPMPNDPVQRLRDEVEEKQAKHLRLA